MSPESCRFILGAINRYLSRVYELNVQNSSSNFFIRTGFRLVNTLIYHINCDSPNQKYKLLPIFLFTNPKMHPLRTQFSDMNATGEFLNEFSITSQTIQPGDLKNHFRSQEDEPHQIFPAIQDRAEHSFLHEYQHE